MFHNKEEEFHDMEVEMVSAPVKSVKKAFDLLSIIIFEDKPGNGIGLTELGERMGIPANSARNTLKSIIAAGFIAQSEDGRYIPGPKARAMIRGRVFSGNVLNKIERALHSLSASLNESMIFVVLANGKRHLVAHSNPDRPIRVDTSQVQNPDPWNYITGRLLLAYSEKELVEETIERFGMPGEKWNDINDLDTLEKELAIIREKGFSTAENDHDEVYSFASPVFDDDKEFIGAIGCFAPQFRTFAGEINRIEQKMKENSVKLGTLISEGIIQ